jgi:hypothetical protein
MSTVTETQWQVRFVGDYFTLTTYISASEEDQAIANATAQLEDLYGMDMGRDAYEAEALETEE